MTPSADLPGFGRPIQPTVQENQSALQFMRQYLDISPDTLSQPMTRTGWDTKWKYQSNASNPSIAMLGTLRVAGEGVDKTDPKWIAAFNQLLDALPEDVRTAYGVQSRLSADERSSAFVGLNDALGLVAEIMVWLENTPPLSGAPNTALFQQAQQGVLAHGDATLDYVKEYLESVGHANPNFDALMSMTSSLGALLGDFKTLTAAGSKASPQSWEQLANDLKMLEGQMQGKSLGNSLQALLPMLSAMTLMANAAALKTGSPSLMVSLGIAQMGMNGSTGMLSPVSQHMANSLSDALSDSLMPNGSIGNETLLSQLLSVGFVGLGALAGVPKGDKEG